MSHYVGERSTLKVYDIRSKRVLWTIDNATNGVIRNDGSVVYAQTDAGGDPVALVLADSQGRTIRLLHRASSTGDVATGFRVWD